MIAPFILTVSLAIVLNSPQLFAKEQKKKHSSHQKNSIPEDNDPWICQKDGKKFPVKGKNDKIKQDHCQAKNGIWQKEKSLTKPR